MFCLLILFKINFFKNFAQVTNKQSGPRSDPTKLDKTSGSKLFAKVKADDRLAVKGLNVLTERQVIWNRYLSHDMTIDMRNLPYLAYINNKGVSHISKLGHFLQEICHNSKMSIKY